MDLSHIHQEPNLKKRNKVCSCIDLLRRAFTRNSNSMNLPIHNS